MEEKRVFRVSWVNDVAVIDLASDVFDQLEIALARENWFDFVSRERPKKVVVNSTKS